MIKLISAFLAVLTIISSSTIHVVRPSIQAQTTTCTVTTSAVIADKIAYGHSWEKHRREFVTGNMIAGLAMPSSPKVTTVTEFKVLILSILGSAKNKALSAKRRAYWGSPTGTIVVYDPNNIDCGTAFRPIDGKPYYDRQN
jgi:hypothetical protein